MKVWEIGVGEGHQVRTEEFVDSDVECYLFEPNPISFEEVEEKFKDQDNFKLFNFALGSENKTVDFYLAKGSSFIDGYHCPELCGNPNAKFEKQKVLSDLSLPGYSKQNCLSSKLRVISTKQIKEIQLGHKWL